VREKAALGRDPASLIGRLVRATNDHDLDGIVACFSDDFVNETPNHPQRSFRGDEQVRTNWRQILAGVPDLRAQVLRISIDGNVVWTEWEMSGRRRDGDPFLLRGVMIFAVAGDSIASARFYLEPVENADDGATATVARLTGGPGLPGIA
jgi:limonene-1,2-epoxide hydrolase